MNSDTKFIIDYSIDITLSSLKTYVIILDINEKLGVDLLNPRSDKERYLISMLFAFCLTDGITQKLEQKEFSEALEKIINDLHEKVKKEENLKKKLFNSIKMNSIDALQTGMWFTKVRQDLLMNTIMVTTQHILHLFLIRKINIITNTEDDHQLIKKGSKCKIGEDVLMGLTNIFNDTNLRITNF